MTAGTLDCTSACLVLQTVTILSVRQSVLHY